MKSGAFLDFLSKIISSVFFIGYLPFVPGTFGSMVGAGLFYLIKRADSAVYFLSILCIILLGLLTSGRMERLLNKKDPSRVVIDEVMGMLVAYSFMPLDLKVVILGFIIFRILDTLKPFPAERLQHMRGAAGIMGDDLIAGIYTNIVLQVVLKLACFKTV
ncbi:MAG: phosphatidylglycerophosphatase A [Candidatus Omnitrophica bacterium]|jgi:phosphatidylglycerophosphatase A|nr:phosphatidylglycerophosphatase A [Candidatus Omnitrophota bacterium]